MSVKRIHILLFLFAALFFCGQNGYAARRTAMPAASRHQPPENLLNLQQQVAGQIIEDILIDSNEERSDDETSSKSKHRVPKFSVTYPTKFNAAWQIVTSLLFHANSFDHSVPKNNSRFYSSRKTPISIAICCFRI